MLGSKGTSTKSLASLKAVTKRFGHRTALDSLDLDVRPGELLALLGPNGAGKSTAISLWLGLSRPDSGQVTLFGGSPLDLRRRRQIGVMMQDVNLLKGLRVRELVAQVASYYPKALTLSDALRMTHLTELADRHYDGLSGGQKRQVQFALAICGCPRLIFLDEPTVGLDIAARESMWANIRRLLTEGCSIVLTTHYLEEAESLAHRVVVISKGRIIASGTIDEVRSAVSRREIRLESRLSANELLEWPGVESANKEGDRLRITASDTDSILRRLLATDADARNIEVKHAGLAEAFSELTKETA